MGDVDYESILCEDCEKLVLETGLFEGLVMHQAQARARACEARATPSRSFLPEKLDAPSQSRSSSTLKINTAIMRVGGSELILSPTDSMHSGHSGGGSLSTNQYLALADVKPDEGELSDPTLNEHELSTDLHANSMLLSASTRCADSKDCDDDLDNDVACAESLETESVMTSMERPWAYLINLYPRACFLAGGAFKNVYKVFNDSTQSYEALSVM